ncbi:hypothetical protein WMY93_008120 [Mugilogobius chulae]|uniref:Uncharacterized protein n=1 Tax=Mugilogobius chulae TaxID=88201 RepID=A0AAW0PIJ5_9GOBI
MTDLYTKPQQCHFKHTYALASPRSVSSSTPLLQSLLELQSACHGGARAQGEPGHDRGRKRPAVYLARPGTADQIPRQKYGGLFSSVQDAFDGKSIDFDALSVGQSTPRSVRRESGQKARSPVSDGWSSPGLEKRAERSLERALESSIETRSIATRSRRDKELLQNLGKQK